MAKTKIADRLSARFKFKDMDHVELVIIDSDTNDIFTIFWNFRDELPKVSVQKEEVKHD